MNSLRTTLTRAIIVAGMFFALTACHKDRTLPEPKAEEKPSGVIPQAQLDALNKAKSVEGTLMQADQQRREQVDQ